MAPTYAQSDGIGESECDIRRPHRHDAVSGADWRRRVSEALLRTGYRVTDARQEVLERIARAETLFTAEELAGELGARFGRGSRATVYRLVHRLRAEGWLGRVHLDGDEHTYYTRQLPGHHQVVCRGCGTALLIGGCDVEALVSPSLAGTGFAVEDHVLELYGRCGECREAERPAWP